MKIGRTDATDLQRVDVRWTDDGPALVGWTADNRMVAYLLPPNEQAALVRRLAGYLATYHRVDVDRTDETAKAAAQEEPA